MSIYADIAYGHEHQVDDAEFSYVWCTPCDDMRQHINGRCSMRQNHPRPCRDCGASCTGDRCDPCGDAHDLAFELDGPVEDWHRGDR